MSAEAIKLKSEIVDEIAGKFEKAQSAVVVEYRGLSVSEVTQLRRDLRAEDVEFKVYKNKLVQRASEKAGYETLNEQLTGPNAIAFGNSDAVAPARILANFAKEHEALVLKAGVVEGKVLLTDELKEIAKLPGRDGMYSMLLGMLQAPVSKFARIVKAVADAKPEDGSAAPTEEAPKEEAAPVEEVKAEETAEETTTEEAAPEETSEAAE
ncbi:MAG: 50S ribosomal protein L10 [Coprobacillaceae bacterium]